MKTFFPYLENLSYSECPSCVGEESEVAETASSLISDTIHAMPGDLV